MSSDPNFHGQTMQRPHRLLPRLALAAAVTIGGILSLLIVVVLALSATNLLRTFRIPTRAMTPTIQPGDLVVVEGVSLLSIKPQRGEIIVFDTAGLRAIRNPTNKPLYYIMRIAGIPGDSIVIKEPRLYVNGKVAEEVSHIDYQGNYQVEVPPGKYFILGDNSWNSFDSRGWGLLDEKGLFARPLLRYWPPHRFGKVDRGEEIRGSQVHPKRE